MEVIFVVIRNQLSLVVKLKGSDKTWEMWKILPVQISAHLWLVFGTAVLLPGLVQPRPLYERCSSRFLRVVSAGKRRWESGLGPSPFCARCGPSCHVLGYSIGIRPYSTPCSWQNKTNEKRQTNWLSVQEIQFSLLLNLVLWSQVVSASNLPLRFAAPVTQGRISRWSKPPEDVLKPPQL